MRKARRGDSPVLYIIIGIGVLAAAVIITSTDASSPSSSRDLVWRVIAYPVGLGMIVAGIVGLLRRRRGNRGNDERAER